MTDSITLDSDNALQDAKHVLSESLVWDCHACMPLLPNYSCDALEAHWRAGVTHVSVNVGMDFNPIETIMQVIASFSAQITARSDCFVLAKTLADVDRAHSLGLMAVTFDLEGSMMLFDRPEMVPLFHTLGVRQMHLAYNRNNSVGGGCFGEDIPLTSVGHSMVRAINESGILLDGSHMGHRTTLDMMACTTAPMIFSHTNVKSLHDHPRCISDQQIDRCAGTGGVIGLCGVNRFMGCQDPTAEQMFRQIDYVASRVGIAHVGLGIDWMYDLTLDDNPPGLDRGYWWPTPKAVSEGVVSDPYALQTQGPMKVFHPSQLPELVKVMRHNGYSNGDIRAVLGGNFYRVAGHVWQ